MWGAINKDAHIIIAPNIGSYVGGDITAGTLVSYDLEQTRVFFIYRPWN